MTGTIEEKKPGLPAKIIRARGEDLRGKDVCLFVAYCPEGKTGPGMEYFLNCFVEQDIRVVLCMIVETENFELPTNRLAMCSAIMSRANIGYDFGAWAGILRAMPELWEAKRLFFVNDSIVGPNENFAKLIESVRKSDEDFIGLTANWIDVYHVQSYFFVYCQRILRSEAVRKFWSELPDYESKGEVIRRCEQYQLSFLRSMQFNEKVMYPLAALTRHLTTEEKYSFNPTHHAWRDLLEIGFPFIKAHLFSSSKAKMRGWSEHFDRLASSEISDQVTRVVLSRLRAHLNSRHNSLGPVKALIGERLFFKIRSAVKVKKAAKILAEYVAVGNDEGQNCGRTCSGRNDSMNEKAT